MTDHPVLIELREALPDVRLLTTPAGHRPLHA